MTIPVLVVSPILISRVEVGYFAGQLHIDPVEDRLNLEDIVFEEV